MPIDFERHPALRIPFESLPIQVKNAILASGEAPATKEELAQAVQRAQAMLDQDGRYH